MADVTVGLVVKLKSGGPNMTVTVLSNDGKTAKCVFFNKEDELKFAEIPIEALEATGPKQAIGNFVR